MLINLAGDEEVLANLVEDETFLETLLLKLTVGMHSIISGHDTDLRGR
jgi:hypothetical protein